MTEEAGAAGLHVDVLGPIRLTVDGNAVAPRDLAGRHGRLVLAQLALMERPVHREELADALWLDAPPRTWERTLSSVISRLRATLAARGGGAVTIDYDDGFYSIAPAGSISTDVAAAEAALHRARAARDGGRWEEAARCAEEAVAALELPLAPEADAPWADARRRSLEEESLEAVEIAAVAYRVLGQFDTAVRLAREAVRREPLRESYHRALIEALDSSGDRAAALRAYENCRKLLVEELGASPSAETQKLYLGLLSTGEDALGPEPTEVELDTTVRSAGPLRAPASRPGLPIELARMIGVPMFGRDAELSWLWAAWHQSREGVGAVAISGPPGIGKTRLAAQFARQLHASGAVVVHLSPNAEEPIDARARPLLARVSRTIPLLVVVDDELANLHTLREAVAARVAPTLVVVTLADASSWRAGPVLRLRGLDQETTAALLEHVTGVVQPGAVSKAVWHETGGSPARLLERGRDLWRAAGAALAERTSAAQGELADLRDELATVVAHVAGVDGQTFGANAGEPPYKGLLRYEPEDAAWFFGREQVVAEGVARLLTGRFLAVVGPSGSGKSSLVRAGLVPVLRGSPAGSKPWQVAITVPGPHPSTALLESLGGSDAFFTEQAAPSHALATFALTLVPSDRHLVLIVDQFEELFTVCRDDRDRASAIAIIEALSSSDRIDASVVVVLRADFYGRCTVFPRLAPLLRDDQILVGPMSESEVRRAIEAPARRVGTTLEPGLVDLIVDDVDGRVGALPLLSTALLETWRSRADGVMTIDGYQRNGGVSGAVARLAEGVYEAFDGPHQRAARDMFLRLAAGVDHRRRVSREELVGGEGDVAESVLALLVRRRLVTAHEGTFEVAHEALFREWPRLSAWLAEDVAGQRTLAQLADAASEWDRNGRDPSECFRGAKLLAAAEWAAANGARLNAVERDFLAASEAAEEQAARVIRRSNRRLRSLSLGLAVVLVGAIVAATLAFASSSRARDEARVATAQRLAVAATGAGIPDLRLLLAAQARRLQDSPQTRGALLTALNDVASVRRFIHAPAPITVAASTPDGTTLVTGDEAGSLELWDAGSGAPIGVPVRAHSGPVTALAVEASTSEVVSAGQDGRVRVARLDDLATATATFGAHAGPVQAVSFVGAGDTIESAGTDGLVRTFGIASGSPEGTHSVGRGGTITLSSDGRLLLHAADRAVAIETATGASIATVDLAGPPNCFAFSADDSELAIGEPDGQVLLHALGGGRTDRNLIPPRSLAGVAPTAVTFSPDSSTVAVAYAGSVVRFREADGAPLGPSVDLRSPSITSLSFGAGSASLFATLSSGETVVLDLTDSVLGHDLGSIGSAARAVAFSADGRFVASAAADATISLFDAASGRRLQKFRTPGTAANAVTLSPDGSLVAAGDQGATLGGTTTGSITIWHTSDGHVVAQEPVPGVAPVVAAQFLDANRVAFVEDNGATWTMDRDGRFAALALGGSPASVLADTVSGDHRVVGTVRRDGTVDRLSTAGTPIGRSLTVPGATASIALDRTGSIAAVATAGAPVAVTGSFDQPTTFPVNDPIGTADQLALDPGGRVLAIASEGTVVLWDLRERARIGSPLALTVASALAFSPDGRQLAIGTSDGRLVLWQTDPVSWASLACQEAGRRLTRTEWDTYLPGRQYDPAC